MRLTKQIGWGLIAVLCGIFLLRVPSFFEPYWYGDEGIYLVLGQMLNRGAVFYRDIWDNKPPLLYLIYGFHPTLLWAKISATIFVLITCAGVYLLSKKIFKGERSTLYSLGTTALTGIFLSLPVLEGTIANAELYFTVPIVWGALLLFRETRWRRWVTNFWVGMLLAIAFLFKVPAIFDFAGFFLAIFVISLSPVTPLNGRNFFRFLFRWILSLLPVVVAFGLPLFVVFAYFYSKGALPDFITAVLSQNAAYVAVGSGPFSQLTNPLFIKGLILLAGSALLAVGYLRRVVSKELFFLSLWFGFSLYGALLSNRPYMHYLLQIVPPGVLLLIYLVTSLKKYWPIAVVYGLILVAIGVMFKGAFALEPVSYYQNFWEYVSEKKIWEDYVNYFDSRTLNSYMIADYLKQNTSPTDPIFVWGDASFIYVLSERPPATRFIQAHHLTTVDPKNYQLVLDRLSKYQPKYILISRPEHFPFPGLSRFVEENYRLVGRGLDLYVYQNFRKASAPAWNPHYGE